jgi:SAM-dependent methyltransferase
VQVSTSVTEQLEIFEHVPCDRTSIPQESLDLANKFRTSLFPWRGQFSPELVELFLNKYSLDTSVILDPFVGSGTTLFEASRKSLACYGAEINPSAVEMARTAHFVSLSPTERKDVFQAAVELAEKYVRPFEWNLFSYQEQEEHSDQAPDESVEKLFGTLLSQVGKESLVCNLLVNAIIRYMSYPEPRTKTDFLRALQEHIKLVKSIPYSNKECRVFHADARSLPLPNASIDLIITSPPYINVFNYHQNNRSAMELLGWDLLNIAKSEIGSNRKNRQNRFLTVVQYTLDMLDVLKEMRRLLRPNGRAIIVVGRESNVRGLSFKNGKLVAALALGGAAFHLESRQERQFKNKFGEIIYEDILHLIPDPTGILAGDVFARSVAMCSLLEASENANEEVRSEVVEARERASLVQKSPLFHISTTPRRSFGILKETTVPLIDEINHFTTRVTGPSLPSTTEHASRHRRELA